MSRIGSASYVRHDLQDMNNYNYKLQTQANIINESIEHIPEQNEEDYTTINIAKELSTLDEKEMNRLGQEILNDGNKNLN